MDAQGRKEPQGRLERQGESLRQKRGDEFKTSPAGRRQQARLFLRKDDWDEEKAYIREDGQRPELTYQQKPQSVEMLIWN